MDSLAIRRVSVWPDTLNSDRGVFAHARDWAEHLGLPLRTYTPAAQPVERGIQEFLHPAELCVFGGELPAGLKDTLLRRAFRSAWTPALICPRSWQPVGRVLVLHQHRDPASRFLDAVAHVCRRFQVRPVVLTVARSDAEARLRQRFAEAALGAHDLAGEFDAVVGGDIAGAVSGVARWRRCAHVFLEKRPEPWWRRLRGDTMGRLLALADSLTVLTWPGTPSPAPAPEPCRGGPPAPGGAATELVESANAHRKP
jgi:hypothetical protein